MTTDRTLGLIFRELSRALARVAFALSAPAAPRVARTEQFYMAQSKHFRHFLALPPVGPDDQDVMTRELTVEFGGSSHVVTAARDDAEARVEVPAGVPVRVTLVDVDDAGNRSQPGDPLDLDGSDTAPPARPGAMSVARTEQFFADDAGTAPAPGPAPTDGGTPAPGGGGATPAPTDGGTPAPGGTDAGAVPAPEPPPAPTGTAPAPADGGAPPAPATDGNPPVQPAGPDAGTAPAGTDAGTVPAPAGTDPNAPPAPPAGA